MAVNWARWPLVVPVVVAQDPASLDASKHAVDLRAHFLRERVRDRELAPEYVATTDNWAD